MTRDEFIDYWITWLRRSSPYGTDITADYGDGTIAMRTPTEHVSGKVLPCNCDREDCLGWLVLTAKVKFPETLQ